MNGWKVYKRNQISQNQSISHAENKVDRIHTSNLLDIGRYSFHKDSLLYIDPTEDNKIFKTYYILSGACVELETKETYSAGDLIVVEGLKDMVTLQFNEDSMLLIHSQQTKSIDRFTIHNKQIIQLLTELQNKDHYTKTHSDRVFVYAKKIGLELGYHSKRIFNLNRAARFHDLGKVFIDDTILNKTSKLTDNEYAEIQKHVSLSRDLILATYDDEVFEIIFQHHERLDGSGYPRALKGSEILQEARIIGICDSFDAMTTDRVYKKGMNSEAALDELYRLSDSIYDKELLTIFIRLYQKGAFTDL